MRINGILLFVLCFTALYVVLKTHLLEEAFTVENWKLTRPLTVNEHCPDMCDLNCYSQPECMDPNNQCQAIFKDNTCECKVRKIDSISPDLYYNNLSQTNERFTLSLCNKNICDSVFEGLPVRTASQITNNEFSFRDEREIEEYRNEQEKLFHNDFTNEIDRNNFDDKYLPCPPMNNPESFGNALYMEEYEIPKEWKFRPDDDESNTPYNHWKHIGIKNGIPFITEEGNYCVNRKAAEQNIKLIRESTQLEAPVNFFVLPDMAKKKLIKLMKTKGEIKNKLSSIKDVMKKRGINID